MSVLVAGALVLAVEQAGADGRDLVRAAQLTPERLSDPSARMPRGQMHALCELALDLTRDPALGLHWAERLGEASFVPVSHLITHAPTLRRGLECLSQFGRLICDDPVCELNERGSKATLRMRLPVGESARVVRMASEMMVMAFYKQVRSFTRSAVDRIAFAYPAPAYATEYQRLFQHQASFEQPFTGLEFDRNLLDLPAPRRDDDVHEALSVVAERRLMQISDRTPYAVRVRDFLVRSGWRQAVDMEAVARSLQLSVRSLRRRLSEEGTSYHALMHEAQAIVAGQFLRDKRRTIQETAFEMGFADASSFHRAFKRWTGTTPRAYRRAQLSGSADRA